MLMTRATCHLRPRKSNHSMLIRWSCAKCGRLPTREGACACASLVVLAGLQHSSWKTCGTLLYPDRILLHESVTGGDWQTGLLSAGDRLHGWGKRMSKLDACCCSMCCGTAP